jgi:hypothetical protein
MIFAALDAWGECRVACYDALNCPRNAGLHCVVLRLDFHSASRKKAVGASGILKQLPPIFCQSFFLNHFKKGLLLACAAIRLRPRSSTFR